MKITLIRHTSVAVEPGICYGQSNVEVSESFEIEANEVFKKIQHIPTDIVYCSPLSRCKKLAAYCGFPHAKTDSRLMEMNFGDWEMQEWNSITDPLLQTWYDNWIHVNPTNGESFIELLARVEDFTKFIKTQQIEHLTIFTHAGVIRAFGILTNHFSIEKCFDFKVSYGDVVEINLN